MDLRRSKPISELAEKAKRSRPEQVSQIQDLPPEMILKILSYLKIGDVVSVAKTCSRLNAIIDGSEDIWKKAFIDHGHERSEVLAEMAASRKATDSSSTSSVEKMNFLLHKKVQRNFAGGLFERALSMEIIRPYFQDYLRRHFMHASDRNVPAILKVIIFIYFSVPVIFGV